MKLGTPQQCQRDMYEAHITMWVSHVLPYGTLYTTYQVTASWLQPIFCLTR